MNPIIALQTILSSAKKHPWLLVLVVLALVLHACDLQWPAYHSLLSTIASGLFGIAFLYAGGTSLAHGPDQPQPEPPSAAYTEQKPQ